MHCVWLGRFYGDVTMAIVLNAGSKSRQLFSTLSSCDLAVNAGSGSDRLLVAIVIQRGTLRTISGITYNSAAMTLAASKQVTGQQLKTSLFYLVAPASGSNTLNVSYSVGTQNQTEIMACVFEGVLQSSPLDQAVSAEGNDAAPTVSVSPTTNNQLVVGGVLHEELTAMTVGSGETSLWDIDQGAWATSASYAIQTTAATQAVNWTANSSDVWAAIAASFKEAVTDTVLSIADTGAGSDTVSQVAVSLAMSDSGAGLDALPGTAVSLPVADMGSAVDLLAQIAASLALSDAGAGLDGLGSVLASLTVADSGAGVDALSILQELLKAVDDAGTAVDAIGGVQVSISLEDNGAGGDALSVTAQISVVDQGAAAELVNLLSDTLKAIFDAGAGTDQVTVSVGVISLADAGEGVDTLSAAVELVITDTGAGVDALSVLQTVLILVSDMGAGVDAVDQVNVSLHVDDTGSGVETIAQILASLMVTDLGAGVDVSVHFDLATRIFRIVFAVARPAMAFSFLSCCMGFAWATPGIQFAILQEA